MLSQKNILVIDDDVDCSLFLEKALSYYGYKVFVAKTGHEAMDLIDKEDWALIFLDISLPDMDGMEVAKYIHSKKEIPIIAVSGYPRETIKKTKPSSITTFKEICEKPFDIDEISKILKKYLK